MKTKSYSIRLYRTTNGIFPTMNFIARKNVNGCITVSSAYKTDAGAKRAILKLAKDMGLLK